MTAEEQTHTKLPICGQLIPAEAEPEHGASEVWSVCVPLWRFSTGEPVLAHSWCCGTEMPTVYGPAVCLHTAAGLAAGSEAVSCRTPPRGLERSSGAALATR
jgi:hypothetical protein